MRATTIGQCHKYIEYERVPVHCIQEGLVHLESERAARRIRHVPVTGTSALHPGQLDDESNPMIDPMISPKPMVSKKKRVR